MSIKTVSCVLLINCAKAQEPNPQPTLEQNSPTQFVFDWTGEAGWTYFIQTSTNMLDWTYLPDLEYGVSHPTYPLSPMTQSGSLSPKFFVQVKMSHYPVGSKEEAEQADFDGDGLSNISEITHSPQTSPLNWDTDGDGFNDGWEIAYGFDPKVPEVASNAPQSDVDLDGYSNLKESLIGLNPNVGIELLPAAASLIQVFIPE